MEKKQNCCGCSALSTFTTCDEQTTTSSNDVEVVMDANTILPTDKIIIIRNNHQGSRVYKAEWNDLSPDLALFILSKSVQAMPQKDPGDGFTLWNDDGFIRVASGVEQSGRVSAQAFIASLEEVFKILPTQNPNDGSPWQNGGIIFRGTDHKKGTENGC